MANGLLDTVGKGLNSAKEGIESAIPGVKSFDTQVGKVIDSKVKPALQGATGAVKSVRDNTTDAANAIGKGVDALKPSKVLKDFDASKGTASIGANIANDLDLKQPSDNSSESAGSKIMRPGDRARAAQQEVDKDIK